MFPAKRTYHTNFRQDTVVLTANGLQTRRKQRHAHGTHNESSER